MQERGFVAALRTRRNGPLVATAGVAAVVIAADQATTSWAIADLHRPVHLCGPLGLALQYNSGTAFSMFSGGGDWIAGVVVVLLGVMCFLAWRARRVWVGVGYGLVVGGALGNLADRLFRSHHGDVVDFITLSHWPTFNISDASITVGVVALIVMLVFRPSGDFHRPVSRATAPAERSTTGLEGSPSHESTRSGTPGTPGAVE